MHKNIFQLQQDFQCMFSFDCRWISFLKIFLFCVCFYTNQKVLSEGVQFWELFLFVWDSLEEGSTISGPSSACRWWPNIECWLGSFVIFMGIRTIVAKKPYFLFYRSGPGSAHDSWQSVLHCTQDQRSFRQACANAWYRNRWILWLNPFMPNGMSIGQLHFKYLRIVRY